jgi:hypothetical protein
MNTSFVYRNISLLYRSLEEIQKNMGFVARRGNTFLDNRRVNPSDRSYTINDDQRFMIETYKEMYNTILQHIEFLYSQLVYAQQQYNPNPNPNFQIPSNLFYFNGHYYTIDPTNPVNTNNVTPNHVPVPMPQLRPFGSVPPPPPPPPPQQPLPAPIQRTHQSHRVQRTFSNPRGIIARPMGNFNDPVNVVATPQQISNATTNVLYENIETPLNDRCPICLDVFQLNSEVTQINHCRHIFNRAQLATWLQTNVRCPVCRFDIRDHVVSQPPSSNTDTLNAGASAPTTAPPAPMTEPDAASMATLNNHLTDILDNFANQAFQNMMDDNATSQILANLFNNNIENLTFDASGSSIMFETFIQDRR